LVGLNVQLHALAVSSMGRELVVHIKFETEIAYSQSGHCGKEKNFLSMLGFKS
jgi:hypothetical protein